MVSLKKYVSNVFYTENIKDWQKPASVNFLDKYSCYTEKFNRCGIRLTIQQCYYYNGKYHTEPRNTGCFLAFRIRLYPEKMSFTQARKAYLTKECFSHKIAQITKKPKGYHVKEYQVCDKAIERFMGRILSKAEALYRQGKDTVQAIREEPRDLIQSWWYVYRNRNEVKCTLWGHRLEWVGLFFIILLICSYVYLRMKRIGSWR